VSTRFDRTSQYTYAISEIEYISSEAVPVRFRVVVEAGD
jgi:hypothetical protein